MDAIINLNKPSGITSYDAIRALKKVCQEKKMGHLGTLDPMANGVLPIFLGKMTKLIPYFNEGDKGYIAEVTLGAHSTTLDKEGELTPSPIPPDLSQQKVINALQSFLGEIEQIPPMYSAIRMEGKRLYELAREGKEVKREPRTVTIQQINNIEVDLPQIRFEVRCSKGTYIRTLAADLGQKLGTEAYLSALTRNIVGNAFELSDSIHLDQIQKLDQNMLLQVCVDPIHLLSSWNRWVINSPVENAAILNGNKVPLQASRFLDFQPDEPHCFVLDTNNQILSVGSLEFSQGQPIFFQPSKVLA